MCFIRVHVHGMVYAGVVYLWRLFAQYQMSSIDDREVLSFLWHIYYGFAALVALLVALLLLCRTTHQKFDIPFAAALLCSSFPLHSYLLTLEMLCISGYLCTWYSVEITKLSAVMHCCSFSGYCRATISPQFVPVLLSRTENCIEVLRKVETTLSEGYTEIERRHNFVHIVTTLEEILPTDLARLQMDFLPEYNRFSHTLKERK